MGKRSASAPRPCFEEFAMSTMTKPLPLPAVSPEVRAFAEEQGVTAYLPAVLEMTRRIFPQASMTVLVEDDPEIANDRHIVLEVDTEGLDLEQLIATRQQWVQDIFRCCPSTHAWVFRIGM